MNIDLSGKKILVTGASRGIGKAITKQLAGAGATIAAQYLTEKKETIEFIESLGNSSNGYAADLSKSSEVIQLFDQVVKKSQNIDVIINNAGIANSSPISEADQKWLKDWDRTLMVNLNATALLCKKAIEHFIPRGGGRIINISSRAAFRGDTPEYLAYAASKGGVVSLTRSIARAYGKSGIKAFNIAPGFVKTDMAKKFIDQYGEEIALNDIALPQLTQPKDISPLVTLLASGLADHATGCTIDINAGSYVH